MVDRKDLIYQVELVRGLFLAWEVAQSEIRKSQQHRKMQYDKGAKHEEGTRVMVFMPQEMTSKERKLVLPYYGPYCMLEVWLNCLLV